VLDDPDRVDSILDEIEQFYAGKRGDDAHVGSG
jgi:hypothetical protein